MGRLGLILALTRLALRDTRRRMVRGMAFLALAGLLFAIAAVAAAVALGIWLARLTDPLSAALILAAGAAGLGLICLGVSAALRRRRAAALSELRAEAERLAAHLKDEAGNLPPGLTLGAAGLIGLILGLRIFGKK